MARRLKVVRARGFKFSRHLKIAFKLLGIVCLPPEAARACGTQRGLVSLGATGCHQTRTRAPAGASGERVKDPPQV